MEIHQGLMLNLKCRVQGEREPDIRWYKDGQLINPERHPNVEISSGVKRSQLRVRNVQLSDSGNYSCIGSSENAELSRWVYVTVLPSPDERKVADEKAYSPCPLNICNSGKCVMINNQPVCRCPSTHSGPRCLQENLPEPSSAAPMILVTPSQDATTGEEDFILDQSHIGANMRMKSAPEGTDKCHLPEFQHSSECTQINSHLYAFVGAAVACSLVILLLGSCLGYIRRRKLLSHRMSAVETKTASGYSEDHPCYPEKSGASLRCESNLESQESPVFCRTYISNSPTIYTPEKPTQGVTPQLMNSENTDTQIFGHPPNIGLNPGTFVVLTSTAPLNLHSINSLVLPSTVTQQEIPAQVMINTQATCRPQSPTSILGGEHLKVDENGVEYIPFAHTPLFSAHPDTMNKKSEGALETVASRRSIEIPCCSSVCASKQLYVQIPAIPTTLYVDEACSLKKPYQLNFNIKTKEREAIGVNSGPSVHTSPKTCIACIISPSLPGMQVCAKWDSSLSATSPSGYVGPDCVPLIVPASSLTSPKNPVTTFQTSASVQMAKSNTFQKPS
ncbi:hypothetical protein CRM22_002851 [Opisthorchis felineus]|uniref:Ig-like domain-containing protein n=1 Tax=Opisthorchis felineus TaxID=147828 RepID=A0A4S2M4L7_OPIFE|nr:hypothetical protein CRM22_002851 [Opisthorchis felineus]